MSLSCSCDFDDYDNYYSWFWMDHSEFKLFNFKRRKRCCSCKSLINHDEESIEFYRYRLPRSEVEENIHGEHVPLANYYMCEECSGLYLALEELGFNCIDITDRMKDLVIEYNEMREELKEESK